LKIGKAGDNFIYSRFSGFSSGTEKLSVKKDEKLSVNSYYDHIDLSSSEGLAQAGFEVKQNGLAPVIIEGKSAQELASQRVNILSHGGKITAELPIIGGFAAEISPADVAAIARKGSIAVIPDGKMEAYLDVASPTIGANSVNTMGYTGKGITVAVLDTGISPHRDLNDPETGNSRIIGFKDFINSKTEPYDDNGHGTHCAGDVASNGETSGGLNVAPAPDASLVGVKVLSGSGSGSFSGIIEGLQWVLENKDKFNPPIKVISMSLGAKATMASDDDPVCQAVEAAKKAGIAVLIAAGNSGPTSKTIGSPGIEPSIITIGAFDDRGTVDRADDKLAYFSSKGPTIDGEIKPDLVSPGYNIKSLKPGGGYVSLSGTSMATPIAAGVVAAMLEANPKLTPDEVKDILMKTAEDRGLDPNSQGAGYIDSEKALEIALKLAEGETL